MMTSTHRDTIKHNLQMNRFLPFIITVWVITMIGSSSMSAAKYKNPIYSEDAPDPSIIRGNDGFYYLFSTAEHVYRSANMVKWEYIGQVFDGGKRPTFVPDVKTYWAPCVTKQDGRYVMYFALSTWGGGDTASIGVATADKPEGPYTIVGDGKLFTSAEVGVHNSIDPNYIEYNGRKYVVWGSWNGIWLIELTADGLAVKDIKKKRQIAGTRFEAPYIYRRGRYFYLFCSIGACCEGERSTYETVVGRSTSLFGPYRTKAGKSMMDNNYELFLTSNTPCIAPGHNSRILEDEVGTTWMTYHGYMRSDPDRGRVVWLDEVKWTSTEWPYIEGNGASSQQLEGPVVKPYSLDVDVTLPEWGVENGVLVPADLTGDGRMSLIIAGEQTDDAGVATPWNTILRQDDAGQWVQAPNGLQTGPKPTIVPADFDGDGQLELLVVSSPHETTNPDGTANGIYFVQTDGSFQRADENIFSTDLSALTTATAATVADVNNDGEPDIVAVGPQGRNMLLLLSPERTCRMPRRSGSAVAAPPMHFWISSFADEGTTYTQVLTADFNADGAADIFAYSTVAAELFLGDGSGNFTPTNWAATCPVPTDGGVAVADVNFDSTLDIICAAASLTPCLNDGTGHFTPAAALQPDLLNTHSSTLAAQLFDWDGDRYADLFYQGANTALAVTTGALWLGSAKGSFSHAWRYGAGAKASTTFLDWNGDGVSDLVTTGNTTDRHLFPFATGHQLSVTLNTNKKSGKLQAPSDPECQVTGNVVQLTWKRGTKSQTYEVYVRDDTGRLYGNVRAHIDGPLAGQRKVLAQGNCGTAVETTMELNPGHYTWGVQRINARFEGSPFATGEFTIVSTGIRAQQTGQTSNTVQRYNALGQRTTNSHRGFQLIRYPDGSVRKTIAISSMESPL